MKWSSIMILKTEQEEDWEEHICGKFLRDLLHFNLNGEKGKGIKKGYIFKKRIQTVDSRLMMRI